MTYGIYFLQLFNAMQGEALTNYPKKCAKMNYGLSVNNSILFLAIQYAEQLEVPRPNAWETTKKPSKKRPLFPHCTTNKY